MNILELIKEIGIDSKRKAACHGGEYSSPCPFCKEGNDRFLVWPNRANKNGALQGGRYSCRVCGRYGDAITFLRQFHGLNYLEACQRLKIQPKEMNNKRRIKLERPSLPKADHPPADWLEKANTFVEWCHKQLLKNPNALEMVKLRGFSMESIIRFKLGYNPGETVNGMRQDVFRPLEEWGLPLELNDNGKAKSQWLPIGLVIPTLDKDGGVIKIKIRRSAWKEGDKLPKYVEVKGSKKCFSIYGEENLICALVIESEFDALLVQQEAADICFCIALGGSTKTIDFQTDQIIRKIPLLLFCPDFDKAGAIAWAKWKKDYPHIERILTPHEKSAGDAFIAGVDLREWIKANLNEIKRKKEKPTQKAWLDSKFNQGPL